jgi:hypothetical protein
MELIGTAENVRAQKVREHMEGLGLGYGGMSGISWPVAVEQFVLPEYVREELVRFGEAMFLLVDTVQDLYGKDPHVRALLSHKRPTCVSEAIGKQRMVLFRGDMVPIYDTTGNMHLMLTEAESVPGAKGMSYAMQSAYGIFPDLVECTARHIQGKKFVAFVPNACSEYVWELAVFCRALQERGIEAKVVFDTSLQEASQWAACNWKAPRQASEIAEHSWNIDLFGRLCALGLQECVVGIEDRPKIDQHTWVYRFGYLENFSEEGISLLSIAQNRWGAFVYNPLHSVLDHNKLLLAAIQFPGVRKALQEKDAKALVLLDRLAAKTLLLEEGIYAFADLMQRKNTRVLKCAAWAGEKSWGARGVSFGQRFSVARWKSKIQELLESPFPVAVQELQESAVFPIRYMDWDRTIKGMDARVRVSPFFFRNTQGNVQVVGTYATFRDSATGERSVHGGTAMPQAPVVFA